MDFMQNAEEPYTMLSISLSECFGSLDTDPSFVEMLARKLYYVMMNSFRITADGKFCCDVNDFETFLKAIRTFTSE